MDSKDIKLIAEALREELKDTKKEWVAEAVKEICTKIGIDTEHPFEMQSDFKFLRNTRLGSEDIQKRIVLKALDYGIVGFIAYVAVKLKSVL